MSPEDRIARLPLWRGRVTVAPLSGGITNRNFVVDDGARRAMVRVGDDIPVHHIDRARERAATRAAHAAGIAPAVLHHEPGLMVLDWIDGRTLTAADLCDDRQRADVVALVARAHREIPLHLRGPAPIFWVFHTLADYAARLGEEGSPHAGTLPGLMTQADALQRAVGKVSLVFGHNDLLPANFLHDGTRLWLVDWEYAGFNSALFDLGAIANAGLTAAQEEAMLVTYYGSPQSLRRYRAMKAASALREAMWSMVQEIHSDLPVDFASYTTENLALYARAFAAFEETPGD
jgi:thiamine kinase-like enzyme